MLKLKNISKHFENNEVLKKVNIVFNEGVTTAILGPSGSGKSTLLRIIDLLEIPEEGTISIFDETLTFPSQPKFNDLKKYRQHFGIVFQAYNLFPHYTVMQNITEGPIHVKRNSKKEAADLAIGLLNKVGLEDKQNSYPSQLSGGQQQRVAIARSLAMNPSYLLYDEPTSALDPELSSEVLATIKELANNGNSQIVVTHDLEFAKEVAHRIIFMDSGEILFDGPAEQFF